MIIHDTITYTYATQHCTEYIRNFITARYNVHTEKNNKALPRGLAVTEYLIGDLGVYVVTTYDNNVITVAFTNSLNTPTKFIANFVIV